MSIAETNADSFVRAIMRIGSYGMELAEIRMDSLEPSEQNAEKIRYIFSRPMNLIATCRPEGMPEGLRKSMILTAIECNASYVDLEVDAPDSYRIEILDKARANGCKTIISHHDFEKTPSRDELLRILERCFGNGADFAKIACTINSERDNARLLGLLDCGTPLIVLGMGEKSRLARIMAPLLGSAFTYASVESGGETAPGQMDMLEVKKLMEDLAHAGFYAPG